MPESVQSMSDLQTLSAVTEVLDFLTSSPSPEQIVRFHASESAQARLRYLLAQHRVGELGAEERAELDEMQRLDHFMTLLKARAFKRLREQAADET